MANRLDVVVFGASGYTGGVAIIEAVKILSKYSWGIAGRNQAKLEQTIRNASAKTGVDLSTIPIIIADVNDDKSLHEMAKRTKVLVNVCGPYRLHGEAVVKACIEEGTHHLDISGEVQFIEEMQLKYNELAERNKVYVISTCGFDSIPADIGMIYHENQFDGQLHSVESYIELSAKKRNPLEASVNIGTWESMVYAIGDSKAVGKIRSKLFSQKMPQWKPKLNTKLISKSPRGKWSVPFPGADRFVVYRTQRYQWENEKKRPIQYVEYISFPYIFILGILFVLGIIFGILSKFSFGQRLLLQYPRIFSLGQFSHDGPSEETRKRTKLSLTFYGKGWSKEDRLAESSDQYTSSPTKTLTTRVTMIDPGYVATSSAILSAAKTLLREQSKMPKSGGVLTPAAAFAKTNLIEELSENGIKFEVISNE